MLGITPALGYTISYVLGIPFTINFMRAAKTTSPSELSMKDSWTQLLVVTIPFVLLAAINLGGIIYLLYLLPTTYAMESRDMSAFWDVMLSWCVFLLPSLSYLLMDGLQVAAAVTHYQYVSQAQI